jgi:DNA-binding MarR family transcriptional regulator
MRVTSKRRQGEDRERGALEGLLEIASRLAEGMAADAETRGLTVARAEVVWVLAHRGPMRQRDLAEELRVSPRNVTGLLDSLEATGFVVRRQHPQDRRAVLVELTDNGREVSADLRSEFPRFANWLFESLDGTELDVLVALEAKLLDRLRHRSYEDVRLAALNRRSSRSSTRRRPGSE